MEHCIWLEFVVIVFKKGLVLSNADLSVIIPMTELDTIQSFYMIIRKKFERCEVNPFIKTAGSVDCRTRYIFSLYSCRF